jgi:hypothetical protein
MEYILVANTVKLKRSSVQGKVPLVSDLQLGELAVNTYDGKLYLKKNVGGTESIVDVSSGLSAAEILTILKTVDGAGSGLDADLVEGMHAVSTNTVNSVVARDASGNFSAGTITAALSGNASTTTKLATARTISITGDVTGSVSFDGSADASITATIAANSVALGTDTTGNYVSALTAGTGITLSGSATEGWNPTVSIGQAVATTDNVTFNTVSIAGKVTNSSEATTVASTTQSQIASFVAASFRSAKLLVQIYDSVTGEVQISELLVAHNGTTASATEYGVVYTGTSALANFDVDINTGNVRLLATRSTANSTQYKVSETLIVA